MKNYACTEEQFLKDVAAHDMTVIRDDGVHRHIRFKRPGEGAYWFDIITWPGALCIDGDMGTYVFRRLDDMFEFFRTDREYMKHDGRQLAINPSYWSEKLQSVATFGGVREFSEEAFTKYVREAFDSWVEEHQPDKDAEQWERDEFSELAASLWEEIEDEVLSVASDGETRAYDAARDFKSDTADYFSMEDCWEWNCKEFTFHFIWCCYAIAWTVEKYDLNKETLMEQT